MKYGKSAGLALAVGVCVGVAVLALHQRSGDARVADAAPHAMSVEGTAHSTTALRIPPTRGHDTAPFALDTARLRRALRNGAMQVELADGTRYSVRMEHQAHDKLGDWNVTGRVATPLGPRAMVLTVGRNASVFGTLPTPDGRTLQIATRRGITTIGAPWGLAPPGIAAANDTPWSADAAQASPMARLPLQRTAATSALATAPADTTSVDTTPVDILVLGLYGNDIVAELGDEATVQAALANMLAVATQAHIDSGSRVRFVLAGTLAVAQDFADNATALRAITNGSGGLGAIAEARNTFGADLVTLLRVRGPDDATCGTAWLAGSPMGRNHLDAAKGFSVVDAAPCGPYAMAHELGHNLGNAHDRASATTAWGELLSGVFAYSHGYRYDGAVPFATIMAEPGELPWIGQFSNPASNACGVPCGIADVADDVRSMNAIAPEVAMYRGTPGTASIGDAVAWEPVSGRTWYARIPVRFTGPLPMYSPFVTVEIVGGTATAGKDYTAWSSQTFQAALDNNGEARVNVLVQGDDTPEPDETIVFKLTSVGGYDGFVAPIEKDTATLTILDEDPRPRVRGHLRFEGVAPPAGTLKVNAYHTDGNTDEEISQTPMTVSTSGPDYAFTFPVLRGSSVRVEVQAPAGTVARPIWFNDVEGDRAQDITVQPGIPVTIASSPTAWYNGPILSVVTSHNYPRSEDLYPPTVGYPKTMYVLPGDRVRLTMDDGYTDSGLGIVLDDVRAPLGVTLEPSESPMVFIDSQRQSMPEGNAGMHIAEFEITLSRVTDAPVEVQYHTVDGTALAGSDYIAASGRAMFSAGQRVVRVPVQVIGDRVVEGSEWFALEIQDPVNAVAISTRLRMVIGEDDRKTGGPSPAERQ
jgi:hypothetical protein